MPPNMRITYTAALVLLIALALGAFGPSKTMNRPAVVKQTLTTDERFARAAQAMCGGENAAWQITQPGVVQCYTHRGAKTITAKVQP